MLIAVESLFLCLTLFIMWTYAISETHYSTHRLLPLIMGLLAVFQFNELARLVFGFDYVFLRLHDIVLVQASYVTVCYFLDYLRIRLPFILHTVLFLVLIGIDYVVFTEQYYTLPYRVAVLLFYFICSGVIIAIMIIARLRRNYSSIDNKTNFVMTVAMALPGLTVIYDRIFVGYPGVEVSIAVEISMIIVWVLTAKGALVDKQEVMTSNIIRNSDMPTMLFDADFYLTYANKAAHTVFEGLDLLPVNTGRNPEEYRRLADYMRAKKDEDEEEIKGRFYSWRIEPVNAHKIMWGYVAQLVDITEQKEETRRMEKLKVAAEEQSFLKARFLAMQSHELRSPLQAIIGISQMLATKKELSPQDRRMANHINSSGNTLLKIVNSILDFSKLESGNFELSNRPYEVLPALMELAQIAVVNLEKKPVIFSIDIESLYPSTLVGDELCVKEMIQNLLSNAIKYTDEGEIRCKIEFMDVPGGIMMTVIVKDTGIGIPESMHESVFDAYSTASSERTAEGTGLGLSTVYQMAKMMQGGAWVEGGGERGTSVGFSVFQEVDSSAVTNPPISIDEFSFKGDKKAKAEEVTPSFCYPEATVLVVDDLKINRRIVKELTAPWQFAIEEAGDGDEAVEMVKNKHYDLIILDLRMPKMPGDEAALLIKEICDTPLVLMSANLFDDTKDEYLTRGFDAILSKPIDMNEVKRILEGFLPDDKRVYADGFYAPNRTDTEIFSSLESRMKTLETFRDEISEAGLNIQKTYMINMAAFQTKVHGIKGAARQLGYVYVADKSEVMEMAAKAEHKEYIERFINEYADELMAAVDEIDAELEHMKRQLGSRQEEKPIIQKKYAMQTEIDRFFIDLKKAFEQYDYEGANRAIESLRDITLAESEQVLLNKAAKALADFEYEQGAELFKDR